MTQPARQVNPERPREGNQPRPRPRHASWHTSEGRDGGGFALLLTVLVLSLVATGLAQLSRRSFAAAVSADERAAALQETWLRRGAENVLAHAEAVLLLSEARAVDPGGSSSAHVPTGPQDPASGGGSSGGWMRLGWDGPRGAVTLRVADEQAKANLNTLWTREDSERFRARLQDLLAWHGPPTARSVWIEPRPLTEFTRRAAGEADITADWPAFGSFHQLTPPPTPAPGSDFQSPMHIRRTAVDAPIVAGSGETGARTVFFEPGPTGLALHELVTLWGNGRLRLDRAAEPAMRLMLEPLLTPGQVSDLVLARLEDPAATTAALIDALELTEQQAELLPDRVTDVSSVYSVTLTVDNGRHTKRVLVVGPGTAEQTAEPGKSAVPTVYQEW